jgi:ribosome-associated translation inhibitor RaiA
MLVVLLICRYNKLMKIKITTTNIELTSAIESYVDEKISSVEKFALAHKSEDPVVEVEVGKVNNHHQS